MNPRGRIGYIDCAKGIAILLVIAGHTVFQEPFRGAVFSFHMPLFFILSAMTSRFSTSAEEFLPRFRKSCRHLLPPAVLCWLIGLLYTPLHNMAVLGNPSLDWRPYLESQLLTLFWGSGVIVKVGAVEVLPLGVLWFFFVLCFGRSLYDLLHIKFRGKSLFAVTLALSALACLLSRYVWLPLSLDIAPAILPFFFVGEYLPKDRLQQEPVKKMVVACALWVATLSVYLFVGGPYLEIAARPYRIFPLSYFTAVCGTLMVLEFSILLERCHVVSDLLCDIGRDSLYLLCIHYFDGNWAAAWTLGGSVTNQYAASLLRIAVDICIMCVFLFIKKEISAPRRSQSVASASRGANDGE